MRISTITANIIILFNIFFIFFAIPISLPLPKFSFQLKNRITCLMEATVTRSSLSTWKLGNPRSWDHFLPDSQLLVVWVFSFFLWLKMQKIGHFSLKFITYRHSKYFKLCILFRNILFYKKRYRICIYYPISLNHFICLSGPFLAEDFYLLLNLHFLKIQIIPILRVNPVRKSSTF